jgi:hypothetical protein
MRQAPHDHAIGTPVRRWGPAELIRILAQRILQELIEAEATAHNGAEPGEHADTRHHCR